MTAATRKALADLRPWEARTWLAVLAIALGVAGFGGVLATEAVLSRELDAAYRATNPASATFGLDRVDAELVEAVRARADVAEAEARRVLRGRVKARPGDWRPLLLFVVDDYARVRVNRVVPQRGAWPPAQGDVLIERDALATARTDVGGSLVVETGAGVPYALRVAGTVHDVGQAQARMEQMVYGYVRADTLPLLGEKPVLDQLLVVASGDAFDPARVRAVAGGVRRFLESQGRRVEYEYVPTPGRHPHADLTSLLLRAQSGFGLVALALGAVVVAHLLAARMAADRRALGVMKAVGATRGRIAAMYLAQAAALGAAAFALGVPAGLAGARVLIRLMAGFLNVDVANTAVPPRVYLLQAAAALAVPVLAALRPVWRGTAVSVREALGDAGTSGHAFGGGRLDRALAAVRGPGRALLLPLRNAFRRRARTASTVLTLACAGLAFAIALSVSASMTRTLDRMFDAMRFDLSASFAPPVPRETAERAAARVPGVRNAEGWLETGASLADEGEDGPHFALVAPLAGSRLLAFQLEEGRAPRDDERDAVVVNTRLRARLPALAPGARVRLRVDDRTVEVEVVGVHREPFAPPGVYASRALLEDLDPAYVGATNSLRLDLDPARADGEPLVAVKAALEQELATEDLRARAMTATRERRFVYDEHLKMVFVFLTVVAGVLGAVGGLGLAAATATNVLERRRELATLRAIGATPRAVFAIVVTEAVVLALAGWALAVTAAAPVSRALGDAIVRGMLRSRLDFVLDWRGPAIWLAVSTAIAVVASAVPAWRAGRLSVREALADE